MVPRALPPAPNRPGGPKTAPGTGAPSPGQDDQLPRHDIEPMGGRCLAGHHGQVPVGVDQQAELPLAQLTVRVDTLQLDAVRHERARQAVGIGAS